MKIICTVKNLETLIQSSSEVVNTAVKNKH